MRHSIAIVAADQRRRRRLAIQRPADVCLYNVNGHLHTLYSIAWRRGYVDE